MKKVRITKNGIYNNIRYKEGEIYDLLRKDTSNWCTVRTKMGEEFRLYYRNTRSYGSECEIFEELENFYII